MTKKRIVATAPIGRTAIDILEQIAPVVTAASPEDSILLKFAQEMIGLVVRGEGRATKQVIEACPELRVIARPGAGYDSVDIATATARRIPVIFAPLGGFAVAEGALTLLLSLIKKVPVCDQVVRQGQWTKRYEITVGDMAEHTLGIIGLGRIGAHLARLAQPFQMTVLGYDPFLSSKPAGLEFVELVELPELLCRSDYVSLHVPLSPETKGLINRERIAQMKRRAILVNTARGEVIEGLDVLADALEAGQLGAVGLDVFPTEPPDASHRIFRDPRLICAPHLLGVSELAMERIYRSMANDVVAVFEHRPPRYCVNPEVLDVSIGSGASAS
jgi:phosphoglycerate dehydrogenase-like enzyme